MNRITGVPLVLYTIAVGIAVVVGSPRYVFAGTALVVTGWLVIGFFSLPQLRAPVLFLAPPSGSIEAARTVAVNGVELPPQTFRLRYLCVLQLSARESLAGWLLLSLVSFYVLLARNTICEQWFQQAPIASTYFGFLVGIRAIALATSWYGEQHFLVKAAITLGTRNQSAASRLGAAKYSFRDAAGGYFGGSGRGQISDPVFVLYDPLQPDNNIPLEQVNFRKLTLMKLDESAAQMMASF